MEDDIKFVVRKSSGAVLEPEVAWKHHYDPIGQNIIKLRKCFCSLPKIRSHTKKQKKSSKRERGSIVGWQREPESLLRIQSISQLPELPDYPNNFPSNGNVLIKKKKHRCKIKMTGILSENAVKKQRLLFVKRILAQTGFSVEDMDSESFALNYLADVADEFLKRFVAAIVQERKRLHRSSRSHTHPQSEDLLHLVETTLKKSGLGGISGLQRYYHHIIKKHDILYRKCQKLIDSYKACLPQEMNNGSMVLVTEVQGSQHVVEPALAQAQSSAVSSIISPDSIYQQPVVFPQDREYCLEVPVDSNLEDFDSDQSVVEINCYPPPNAKSETLVSSQDYQQISEDSSSSDDHEKSSTSCELLTQGIHAPPHSSLHESIACSRQKKSSSSIRKVSFSTTTQKHYFCDHCNRNYASMSSLNRHLNNDHNIPPPKKKR